MTKRSKNPFVHAFRGMLETYRSERNFRIHLAVAAVAVGFGLWMELSASEWRWIVLCIALVCALELMNTAVEALVDLLSPAEHPLARKAKDAAAGAVLVAAAFSVVVGWSIFFPKLWGYLFG